LCGQQGRITVNLGDIDLNDGLHCEECSEDFGTDTIREMLAGWTKCLAWLDAAPPIE